jgi:GAF domain-containing protein
MLSLADTLVSDFELTDLFYELIDASKELLDVTEAGLLVSDNGESLRVVAATSEAAHLLELMDLEVEGPGLETFRSASPVRSGSLRAEAARSRWPAFSARALEAGFERAWAFPLRLREKTVGALNLLQSEDKELHDEDILLATALADMAAIAILQHRVQKDEQLVIAGLQTALESRVMIEQAKGITAQELGVGMDEAFDVIRSHARKTNQRLHDVARAISSGRLSAKDIGA